MRKPNKKGNVLDVGLTMVILFILGILFVIGNVIIDEFGEKWSTNSITNSSVTSVQMINTTQNLVETRFDWVGFVILIGMILAIIITAWLVAGNPIFTFIYFMALLIMILVSAILSFTWDKIMAVSTFAVLVDNFPIMNYVIQNFPVIMTIIGFIGMVVTFAKPQT